VSGYAAAPVGERFWSKVAYVGAGPDDCWEWDASRDKYGYGQFSMGHSECDPAHRVAYALAHGAVPAGLFVCHSCDNPPCVNPSHLWLGTAADNNRDRDLKGRGVPPPRPLKKAS
jgi:hypothetical protein